MTKDASKRVCIIGAGANGLATLKVLAETHQVQLGEWLLVAFEERQHRRNMVSFINITLFLALKKILLELGIPPPQLKILP